MYGISGRPYSVLQLAFFGLKAGMKANRIRFFCSIVGVDGKPKSKLFLASSVGGARLRFVMGMVREGFWRVCAFLGGGRKVG